MSVRDILAALPDDPAAGMLPAACYTDPEWFAFEQRVVFPRQWLCVGHTDQIVASGDVLSAAPAGEPILVVRDAVGAVRAFSAVCQHRGALITCEGKQRHLRCPLHFWTYDLGGALVGAPRTTADELRALRESVRLREVRLAVWHGLIFVNLDGKAADLAACLAKVEPLWEGYGDLVAVPPRMAETALPWNWKVHVENFTDAYHPEFVHRGTHDFAPSVGVAFLGWEQGDGAIVRTVPLVQADGGMMADGWGAGSAFPVVQTLSAAQRSRLEFVMIPPSLTLVFSPQAVAYTLVAPVGAEATLASSDRVTAGGWLVPRATRDLADFQQRAALVVQGGGKIWAQDVPLNLGMQAGKRSGFVPKGLYLGLEATLVHFNAWLLWAYRGVVG